MDSGACLVLCGKSEHSACLGLSDKQDESIVTMAVIIDVPKPPEATDYSTSMGPMTPDANRENGDFQLPFTVVKKLQKPVCIDSKCNDNGDSNNIAFVDNASPQTPKDGVCDPFPGPDNMGRTPQSIKYLDELSSRVAQMLNFDDMVEHKNPGDDAESLSDQEIFESVYKTLLEAIISKQTGGVHAEISNVEYNSNNCKTPPSVLQLCGIADRPDTCPGAPVKQGSKSRNIPLGLCKKLEF